MKRKEKKPDPFYLSKAWREIRIVALTRDNWLCQRCLRHGRLTPAGLVHHVKPRKEYPALALDLDNLESLCWKCHNIIEPSPGWGAPVKKKLPKGIRVIKG